MLKGTTNRRECSGLGQGKVLRDRKTTLQRRARGDRVPGESLVGAEEWSKDAAEKSGLGAAMVRASARRAETKNANSNNEQGWREEGGLGQKKRERGVVTGDEHDDRE